MAERDWELIKKNQELIDLYVKAAQEQKYELQVPLFAEPVVFHLNGRNPTSGESTGTMQEIYANWGQRPGMANFGFELLEVVDSVVNERRAVLLLKVRLSVGDKSIVSNRCDIYTIEDGKIVDVRVYDDDQYGFDELFQ